MKRNATYLMILIATVGATTLATFGASKPPTPIAPATSAMPEQTVDLADVLQSTSVAHVDADQREAQQSPTRIAAPTAETAKAIAAKRGAWQTEAKQLQDELMQALLRGDADSIDKAQRHAKRLTSRFAQ